MLVSAALSGRHLDPISGRHTQANSEYFKGSYNYFWNRPDVSPERSQLGDAIGCDGRLTLSE